jgi:hypothetical protein
MNKKTSRIEILERDGWEKKFVASEPRLSEAVETYEQAGFEVHLEPLPPADEMTDVTQLRQDHECRQCFEGFEHQYKIIFTRTKKNIQDPGDDHS